MSPDRRTFLLAGGAAVAGLLNPHVSAQDQPADPAQAAKEFIAAHEAKLRPLEIAAEHRVVGREHHRQGRGLQAEGGGPEQDRRGPLRREAVRDAQGDQGRRATRARSPTRTSPGRSICSTSQYLEKQVPPELLKKITAKANAVEQTFNVFRAKVDGKEMADSKVRSDAQGIGRFRAAPEGVGGEQGRRRSRRGGPEGTREAPQRGGDASSGSRTSTP